MSTLARSGALDGGTVGGTRRVVWAWFLAVPLLLWAVAVQAQSITLFADWGYVDFARFYQSAAIWLEGQSLYAPTSATLGWLEGQQLPFPNLNPPHLTLVFLPFTALPLPTAALLWLIVMFLAYGCAAQIIVDTLRVRLSGAVLCLVTAGFLLSSPTVLATRAGQISGLTMLLATAIWRDVVRERWTRAAILIGIAVSLKLLFGALILWLLVRRDVRSVLVALGSFLACVGVGLLVFGWQEYAAWIAVVRAVDWPWIAMNSSLTGVLTRVARVWSGGDAIVLQQATTLGLMVSAPVLLGGVWVAGQDPDRSRGYLLVLVTSLLTFPAAWLHYWWILAGPLADGWRQARIRQAIYLSFPAWAIPFWWLVPYDSIGWALSGASLYGWGLLALAIGTVRSARAGVD